MKSFEDWFAELISDQLWYELLRHYKDSTIKEASEKVFASLVADRITDVRPMKENRKHVYNILIKSGPGDKPKGKPFQVVEAEKKEAEKEKEWKPADPTHVDKCVEEFNRMLANAPIMTYKPPKKEIFYNGKSVEKIAPYPVTSIEEAYIKTRHFEYIKANYEPRTGKPLTTWMDETKWNQIYDSENK